MWTHTALASEARPIAGLLWRVVEHQYTASTRKIVATQDDQDLLEDILEESKPPMPAACRHLDYLLKTPFRYRPTSRGSRFRVPGPGPGVFYAAEQLSTAQAEYTYWRLRFFLASPNTPLPRNEARLTAFSVRFATQRALDLTEPPLAAERTAWCDPCDYTATHALSVQARRADLNAIRYESVRDPQRAANVALLDCASFTVHAPLTQQTWYLFLGEVEANWRRAHGARHERVTFKVDQFEFCS